MKKTLFKSFLTVAVAAISFSAIAQDSDSKLYGKEFDTKKAITVAELPKKMGDKKEMPVVITGTIAEVCQVAGCWITLKNEDGKDVFVKIREHAFEIPKDMAGHKASVAGTVVRKAVSVDELKHYAEDAGKSSDEIATITEPTTELRINATGILIE